MSDSLDLFNKIDYALASLEGVIQENCEGVELSSIPAVNLVKFLHRVVRVGDILSCADSEAWGKQCNGVAKAGYLSSIEPVFSGAVETVSVPK